MHALKLYGPRTGRQNPYSAARGPGVWCDWGTNNLPKYLPILIVKWIWQEMRGLLLPYTSVE